MQQIYMYQNVRVRNHETWPNRTKQQTGLASAECSADLIDLLLQSAGFF